MMDTLRCVATPETIGWIDDDDIRNGTHRFRRINDICKNDTGSDCTGVQTKSTAGQYGAFRYYAVIHMSKRAMLIHAVCAI